MEKISKLKSKITDNTLTSAELFLFTQELRDSRREGNPTVRNVSPANIDLLEIYAFALQKLEMAQADQDSGLRAADWRDRIDDFSKLKKFVDDLEKSELIKNVSWNVGGMALYDIKDPEGYKTFVYWNIQVILDNMLLFEKL